MNIVAAPVSNQALTSVGHRLEEVRVFYLLPVDVFCLKIGISEQDYAAILSGTKPLNNAFWVELSDELDVRPEWLRFGEGDALYRDGTRDVRKLYQRFCRIERYHSTSMSHELKTLCAERLSRLPPGHAIEDELVEELFLRVTSDPAIVQQMPTHRLPIRQPN